MKAKDKEKLLIDVEQGKTVTLCRIDAGGGLRNRLAALGVLPNSEITVVRNVSRGQVIIKVKESRVVLGRGMAEKIFVV